MRYFVGADCSEDEDGFDFDAAGGMGGENDDDDNDDDDDSGDGDGDDGDDDDDDDDDDGKYIGRGWGGQQFRAQSRKQVQEVLWQARKILSKERWVKGLSLRGKARVPVLYIRSGKPQRLGLFQLRVLAVLDYITLHYITLHCIRISAMSNYVS